MICFVLQVIDPTIKPCAVRLLKTLCLLCGRRVFPAKCARFNWYLNNMCYLEMYRSADRLLREDHGAELFKI